MASERVAAQRRVLEIAEALDAVPGLKFNDLELREYGDGGAGVDVDLWVREEFEGFEAADDPDHEVWKEERDEWQERAEELENERDVIRQDLAEVRSERNGLREDLEEIEAERDRLQKRSEQLAQTINRQAEKIAELQADDAVEPVAEPLDDDPDQEDAGEQLVVVHSNEDAPLTTYHEDPECRYAKRIDEPREVPLSELGDGVEPCGTCEGGAGGSDSGLDEDQLREAYEEHDGVVARVAEEFEHDYSTVYSRLRELGIHEANTVEDDQPESDTSQDTQLSKADREQAVRDVLEESGPMYARDLREAVAEKIDRSPSWAKEFHEEMAREGEISRWADPENGTYTYYGLPEQEPEDTDVEHEHSYPNDCTKCGATLEGSVEESVHRTEEHGKPQGDLGYLEQGEFAAIVEDAEDVNDIVDEVSFEFEKVLRVLGVYGLEDVVGGDVELSDVNDFEFDGVDEDEEEPETDESATIREPAPDPEDPPTAAKICMRHDLDREEVIDAIADAQGVFHVRRDLNLSADVADTLLNELGFLEELKGTGFVGRERAKEEVKKHVPRSVAADGGGRRA